MSKLQILAFTTLCLAICYGFHQWTWRVTPETVEAGRQLFERDWCQGDELCGQGDGLGPSFNATSCVACHSQGGIGGSSGNDRNVVSFEVFHEDHPELEQVSGVIHSESLDPNDLETVEDVRRAHPAFEQQIETRGMCNYSSVSTVTVDPVIVQELNSPALFGVGLIDSISDTAISTHNGKRLIERIGNELNGEFGGNRVGMVPTHGFGIGKFGWKGQFSSLEDFIASACAMELGLTNHRYSQVVPKKFRSDESAKPDMTRRQLHELVAFVRSLPRPVQVLPKDETELARVRSGEQLFVSVGCSDCHVADMGGVEGIYSDFHLYNLEPPEIASSSYSGGGFEQEFDMNRDKPHPDQWQTPPLWGVADSAPYFHDGASATLMDAIRRHDGQARSTKVRFDDLSETQQRDVVRFLQTLRAPQSNESDKD